MTIAPSMLLALRAVRDGERASSLRRPGSSRMHPAINHAEHFWLLDGGYINADGTLTLKGHNELNNADNRNEDKK